MEVTFNNTGNGYVEVTVLYELGIEPDLNPVYPNPVITPIRDRDSVSKFSLATNSTIIEWRVGNRSADVEDDNTIDNLDPFKLKNGQFEFNFFANEVVSLINNSTPISIPNTSEELFGILSTMFFSVAGGGGGGGDATAANQVSQIGLLTDIESDTTSSAASLSAILSEVTSLTTPTDVQLVQEVPILGSRDAFNRVKTSSPYSLFSSVFTLDRNPYLWEIKTNGTGSFSFDSNKNHIVLTTGTAAGRVISEQHGYNFYQPDRGQSIKLTGTFGTTTNGYTKIFGYFNDNNGLYVKQDSAGVIYVGLRTFTSGLTVDTDIPKSSWNINTLPSTIHGTVDFEKDQIYFFDLQYLGAGMILFGVVSAGEYINCHVFYNVNIDFSYMQTVALPIRYEIINTGSSSVSTLTQICAAVNSDGGTEPVSYPYSAANLTGTTVNATARSVLSLRCALLANGVPNRSYLKIDSIEVFKTSVQNLYYEIVYQRGFNSTTEATDTTLNETNGNTGLATWTSITNSYAEQCFSANTISGGTVISRGSLVGSSRLIKENLDKIKLSLNKNGTVSDNLHVVIRSLGGPGTAYAIINYKEYK